MSTEYQDRNRTKTNRALSRKFRLPGVLVVDELALHLVLLKLEFEQLGCVVWLAGDGLEALRLYEQHQDVIDLVVLEAEMVGLDGPQTLACLREIDPEVRCCFMMDKRSTFSEMELRMFGAEFILDKPFHPVGMSRRIWTFLSQGSCRREDADGVAR